jgi:hypothetical protein
LPALPTKARVPSLSTWDTPIREAFILSEED